jgi:hypothetical protein
MMIVAAPPEGDPTAMPAKKSTSASKKKTPARRAVAPVPSLEPEMMNDLLLAIHDKADEIDAARIRLDSLIGESDALIREAVDEGERYRDIAAAAGRTVPWVQMSLRRVAGVPTHPAAPIPDTRIRKTRRAS